MTTLPELRMHNQGYEYIACPVTAILTNGIEVDGGEAVCVLRTLTSWLKTGPIECLSEVKEEIR